MLDKKSRQAHKHYCTGHQDKSPIGVLDVRDAGEYDLQAVVCKRDRALAGAQSPLSRAVYSQLPRFAAAVCKFRQIQRVPDHRNAHRPVRGNVFESGGLPMLQAEHAYPVWLCEIYSGVRRGCGIYITEDAARVINCRIRDDISAVVFKVYFKIKQLRSVGQAARNALANRYIRKARARIICARAIRQTAYQYNQA